MAIGYPSGTNTYVPNHAASLSLVVGFSRSANQFPLPSYVQYVPAKNNQGLYFIWASRQAARIIEDDDARSLWADGDAAPTGNNNLEGGQWAAFLARRRAYPFTLGNMAVEQATYPLLAAESAVCAQQAMTARSMLVQSKLSAASWGNNTAAVNGTILTSGQTWATGSVGFPRATETGANIKVSLQYGSKQIHLQTIGVVQPSMLTLLVNPGLANIMASSTEIQDYLKQSPFALAQLRGDVPNQNGKWGLPTVLYTTNIVVEDTVRVTSRKGASSDTLAYVLADATAFLVARQGELEGIEGTRSFSTVQVFFYIDELTVWSKQDSDNLRYLGRVVSTYDPVVVSTLSGFKFTACS